MQSPFRSRIAIKDYQLEFNLSPKYISHALEVFGRCLDKADEDHNRELLHDVNLVKLSVAFGLTI